MRYEVLRLALGAPDPIASYSDGYFGEDLVVCTLIRKTILFSGLVRGYAFRALGHGRCYTMGVDDDQEYVGCEQGGRAAAIGWVWMVSKSAEGVNREGVDRARD